MIETHDTAVAAFDQRLSSGHQAGAEDAGRVATEPHMIVPFDGEEVVAE